MTEKINIGLNYEKDINHYLQRLIETISNLDRTEINAFIKIITDVYSKGKNIYVFGNGGSALTASHFVGDLNKGASYPLNKRFKAISLNDNIATLMAYANDVSYEDIFVEQLKNFLTEGDIVIGISGSGNSKNVLKAIEYANLKKNITIGITGYDGGLLRKISKFNVNANINDMLISEDIHMILSHLTIYILKTCYAPDKDSNVYIIEDMVNREIAIAKTVDE